MRTQISALVGGQEQWLQTEQYLNQVAQEHNKTILDIAQSYACLSVLQEAGLVTQREQYKISMHNKRRFLALIKRWSWR
ncbi:MULTISPECIES: hypothetical protein [unclassified Vibrio]|jgi:Fe2+ or Zn2+ uptake regulation protein|uniref:hypothetical protein n=1 Tax=unclassified Vibrio TaxID=2614977 RepID=UPI001A90697F|nr:MULTISPECIES: hypothetical protein [unclassified Vibrio]MBO0210086.1 hypothetical protein [Vibrio sp. Vb0877]MDU9596082.1 hypothetical protein [Vibrio sp. 2-1-2a]MDU9605428.1 hypothetical protein [Vibrio sp. 1-2-3a]